MENQNTSILKHSMTYGLGLGVALIIYSVLLYVLDLSFNQVAGLFVYVIILAGIIISTKMYRDKILGGNISYGTALGFGTLVVVFGSLISGIFGYFMYEFIAPELLTQMLEKSEEQLLENGMPEEQIEMAIEIQRKMMKPALMVLWSVIGGVFVGFIMSLITSIFLKKEANPFQNVADDNLNL